MCSFQLTLFVAVRTHKNQDKPLAVDANVSASHGWRSRLKILEQAQIFSARSTITLRVLHQPQGDKQEINLPSVTWQYTITFTEATPPDVYPETMCLLWDNVYFLFIALRLMQNPVGWWWSGLKISELAQGFSDGCAIHGSQRHLHQAQGVYLGFCESVLQQTFPAENVIFLTTTETTGTTGRTGATGDVTKWQTRKQLIQQLFYPLS